jgi:hypothetical protein
MSAPKRSSTGGPTSLNVMGNIASRTILRRPWIAMTARSVTGNVEANPHP